MWIKKSEWVSLLTNSHEYKVRAEMMETQLESYKKSMLTYSNLFGKEKDKNTLLTKRVSELEKKLLEMNEVINSFKRNVIPPTPLNLAEMFDEEDEEEVEKDRERIRKEGADILLAEMMET